MGEEATLTRRDSSFKIYFLWILGSCNLVFVLNFGTSFTIFLWLVHDRTQNLSFCSFLCVSSFKQSDHAAFQPHPPLTPQEAQPLPQSDYNPEVMYRETCSHLPFFPKDYLCINSLTSKVADLSRNEELRELRLNDNQLTTLPLDLKANYRLNLLDIGNNQFSSIE